MAVEFEKQELARFQTEFQSFDQNGDGHVSTLELEKILRSLGEYRNKEHLDGLIAEVDSDKSGTIEFNEFLAMISSTRCGKVEGAAGFAAVYEKQKELIQIKGHSGLHSFSQEEMTAFAEHINNLLGNDPDLAHIVPIDPSGTELAQKVFHTI